MAHVDTTRNDAAVRKPSILPHLMPTVKAHLNEHTAPRRDSLLFPSMTGRALGALDVLRQRTPRVHGERGQDAPWRARVLQGPSGGWVA